MRAHDKVEVFDFYHALKLLIVYEELSTITVIDEEVAVHQVKSKDPLKKVLVNQKIEGAMDANEIVVC